MNVVLYLRYSSDKQTEQSIEGQDRVCTEFCERNDYTIVGRYIDRATSAFKDTDKRVQFQQMIRDAEKRQWDAVVVYKLDRFARNKYDSATFKYKLNKYGVRVISATENISDNPEGIILEAVLEGMAEYYSRELSQKVRRGCRESALKAKNLGGTVPLGYKLEDHRLVIDPVGAKIVKEAFELYSTGTPVSTIVRTFNARGYRTVTGKEFNKNSFHNLFYNKRYIGTYIYDGIEIENAVPAIVDRETFEKAQKRRKTNAICKAKGKAKSEYLLTQKLFCGHCGALMVGESGTNQNGDSYYYYTCVGRKRTHSCDKKPIRKEVIEQLVIQDILSYLSPDIIEHLADMAVRYIEEENAHNTRIPVILGEIAEIEKRKTNLLKLVESGYNSPDLIDRLAGLDKEKQAAETRLAEEKANLIAFNKQDVIDRFSDLVNSDPQDINVQRTLIDMVVRSVTVWDEPDGYKVTIAHNLDKSGEPSIYSDSSNDDAPCPANPNNSLGFLFVPSERIFIKTIMLYR